MNQLQKYTWLIETIRRAGKISFKDLSDKWERSEVNDENAPLARATFNRWKDAIFDQFGIAIACQRTGGYLYYVDNPDDLDKDNQIKRWMLDTFAVGNLVSEHLAQKDRILVDEIPSGRVWLTAVLSAIKENRIINLTYQSFQADKADTYPVAPYCVRLFGNRWYMVAYGILSEEVRIYGLDRIKNVETTEETFTLPADFSARDYFSDYYGVVTGMGVAPERVVLRAYGAHRNYLASLPLHHSQELIEDCGEYADFKLYLAPTYDFVMKLLSMESMIEVMEPLSLRKTMKDRISEMHQLYQND